MTSATVTLLGLFWAFSAPVEEDHAVAPTASDEPLLVVVERSHGATASPEAVRHAVAEELHRPVVGPGDAAGKSATQMLVVTIAPDSVGMQMRAAGDAAARRRIQPLMSGESSLRVVAWLAGNLARDQVTELMDALPAAPPVTANSPPAAPTQPPPAATELAAAVAPPAVVGAPSGEAPWRIELSVGRSKAVSAIGPLNWDTVGSTGIELLAPSRPGHWSWTVGFESVRYTPGNGIYIASGGFVRRFALVPGWLVADAVVGGGLSMMLARYPAAVQQADGSYFQYVHQEAFGPYFVGQVSGSVAFVRLHFGELVTTVRIIDSGDWGYDSWKVPLVTLSAGFRVALW